MTHKTFQRGTVCIVVAQYPSGICIGEISGGAKSGIATCKL